MSRHFGVEVFGGVSAELLLKLSHAAAFGVTRVVNQRVPGGQVGDGELYEVALILFPDPYTYIGLGRADVWGTRFSAGGQGLFAQVWLGKAYVVHRSAEVDDGEVSLAHSGAGDQRRHQYGGQGGAYSVQAAVHAGFYAA